MPLGTSWLLGAGLLAAASPRQVGPPLVGAPSESAIHIDGKLAESVWRRAKGLAESPELLMKLCREARGDMVVACQMREPGGRTIKSSALPTQPKAVLLDDHLEGAAMVPTADPSLMRIHRMWINAKGVVYALVQDMRSGTGTVVGRDQPWTPTVRAAGGSPSPSWNCEWVLPAGTTHVMAVRRGPTASVGSAMWHPVKFGEEGWEEEAADLYRDLSGVSEEDLKRRAGEAAQDPRTARRFEKALDLVESWLEDLTNGQTAPLEMMEHIDHSAREFEEAQGFGRGHYFFMDLQRERQRQEGSRRFEEQVGMEAFRFITKSYKEVFRDQFQMVRELARQPSLEEFRRRVDQGHGKMGADSLAPNRLHQHGGMSVMIPFRTGIWDWETPMPELPARWEDMTQTQYDQLRTNLLRGQTREWMALNYVVRQRRWRAARNDHPVFPALGLTLEALRPAYKEALAVDQALLVSGVEPGGSAFQAGLLMGDLILRVDQVAVGKPGEFRGALEDYRPKSLVPLEIRRRGNPKKIMLRLPDS